MRLPDRCRPALPFLALSLLLCAPPRPGLALDLLQNVSQERAKELGISVRVQPRPDDVWVQVEFRPTGPKKEFKRTDLDITQGGKKLVNASLMPRRACGSTSISIPPSCLTRPSRSSYGRIRSPASATASR
jgi:hypothetical protein